MEEMKAEAMQVINKDVKDLQKGELLQAMETLDSIEEAEWQQTLEKIKADYPADLLRKMVYKAILDNIEYLRHSIDREYVRNDELRSKGVSFSERMASIDFAMIERYESHERKYKEDLKRFRVLPVDQWIDPIGYRIAKDQGKGIQWIIKINLGRCYTV